MNSDIAILILAAGESSRMKRIKQLLPWGNTTLLGQAIEAARTSSARSVQIVLGAYRDQIVERLDLKSEEIIVNGTWKKGMGESIAIGVEEILKKRTPDAILIMLCDQPFIDTEYLNIMIQRFKTADRGIIGTNYTPKVGVPALFGPDHFDELTKLAGDRGAGSLIDEKRTDCIGLNADGKEIDIDNEATYLRLYPRHGSGDPLPL